MHMKAVTWHGKRDVRVESVPDPIIEEPTDAIIEITSTNICGSDLHLYEVLGAFMNPGDILGHEPMGIVREVGRDITNLAVGDRVVIPFQISCGSCYMCDLQLYKQCETTQVRGGVGFLCARGISVLNTLDKKSAAPLERIGSLSAVRLLNGSCTSVTTATRYPVSQALSSRGKRTS
jgi:D-arabinose 1-dehydrogenase-like Zn-dependent alcohol dehydrogenase